MRIPSKIHDGIALIMLVTAAGPSAELALTLASYHYNKKAVALDQQIVIETEDRNNGIVNELQNQQKIYHDRSDRIEDILDRYGPITNYFWL
jgi:hypothetical protein|tara:strand:+ start:784 stop:1059 length:276 start_codon:yes stop_codon:yes gene_type:complete